MGSGGIAGFVDGVFKGMEWREARDDRKRQRAIDDENQSFRRERQSWDRQNQEYTTSERERKRKEDEDLRKAIALDMQGASAEVVDAPTAQEQDQAGYGIPVDEVRALRPRPAPDGYDLGALGGGASPSAASVRPMPDQNQSQAMPPMQARQPRELSIADAIIPSQSAKSPVQNQSQAMPPMQARQPRELSIADAIIPSQSAKSPVQNQSQAMPPVQEKNEFQLVQLATQSYSPGYGMPSQNYAMFNPATGEVRGADMAQLPPGVADSISEDVRQSYLESTVAKDTAEAYQGVQTNLEEQRKAEDLLAKAKLLRSSGMPQADVDAALAQARSAQDATKAQSARAALDRAVAAENAAYGQPDQAAQAQPSQQSPQPAPAAPAAQQAQTSPTAAPQASAQPQAIATQFGARRDLSFGVVGKDGPVKTTAARTERAASAGLRMFNELEMPNTVKHFLSIGDLDSAKAWQAWTREEGVQRGIKSYMAASHALSIGDEKGAEKYLRETFNNADYVDNGYSVIDGGVDIVRDDVGKIAGAKITFKNDQTGETFTQQYDDTDILLLGHRLLAPQNVFEESYNAVAKAEANAAEARLKAQSGIDLKDAMSIVTDAVKAVRGDGFDLTDRELQQKFTFDQILSMAQLISANPTLDPIAMMQAMDAQNQADPTAGFRRK